ncbi:unnamed protein product [Peniophora sp. CBMAI 1063]|nr:unnamed protein product [Peniophora sp. CBMAI 1063]
MADTDPPAFVAYSDFPPPVLPAAEPAPSLKRRASDSFGDRDDGATAKRAREDSPGSGSEDAPSGPEEKTVTISGAALADDLEQDLMCGCCSALLYRPVVVNPCQHYFCGSCLLQWVRNGGTSCPACRAVSTSVTNSRVLQLMIDILLRHDPTRARTQRERDQADAIYRSGQSLRIPPPRELSPEPALPPPGDWVHPCPTCTPGNRWGYHCPQPIPEPDGEAGWQQDDGAPPGHALCFECRAATALNGPTIQKCDFCQTIYCGMNRIQGRCSAAPLFAQHPQGFGDIGEFIQNEGVYDAFSGNTVEVDYLIEYMNARHISPRSIYRDIIEHIRVSPRGFAPLIEQEVFLDTHGTPVGGELPADAPRNRICRPCAGEVLLWGIREWWARERRKGHLPQAVSIRPDCENGATCHRQDDHAHCRDFNHIIAAPAPPQEPVPAPALPPLLADLDFPPLSLQPHAYEDDDEDDDYPPPPMMHYPPPPMASLPVPPATAAAPMTAASVPAPAGAPSNAPMSQYPLSHVTFVVDEQPTNPTAARDLENMMQHIGTLNSAAERDLDMMLMSR